MRCRKPWIWPYLRTGGLLAVTLCAATAWAEPPSKVQTALEQALEHRQYGQFEKAIALLQNAMLEPGLKPEDSISLYEVLGMTYFSRGKAYYDSAFACLGWISTLGHCLAKLPGEGWPSGLRVQWYRLGYDRQELTCPTTEPGDYQTIAVLPFDNFSVSPYATDLGALGHGLSQIFVDDFRKVSSLRVVERDKLAFLIAELKLQDSVRTDPRVALRVGRLLGAQLMVFGSFTQVSGSSSQMTVRVVDVETSEIITSSSKEGRPDYFKLEKFLVQALCTQLDLQLSKAEVEMVEAGGSESFDATSLYAKGLTFEDQLDYESAYRCFEQAYAKDERFTEAKRKMDIYKSLVLK